MPSLETLNLTAIDFCQRPRGVRRYRDWFHVIDTIRDHPRALQLNFDIINFAGHRDPKSFSQNTGDLENSLQQIPNKDWMKERRSLALYLGGKSELDDTIQLWFDRDDSPDV